MLLAIRFRYFRACRGLAEIGTLVVEIEVPQLRRLLKPLATKGRSMDVFARTARARN